MKEGRTNVKVFDFFSGCGGASCGFRTAGMDVVFALDRDRDARRTFERNFPGAHFECADIRKTPPHRIRELSDAQRPAPILFCGCAPCQPFTKQNTTRPTSDADARVTLLTSFATIIEHCKPDVVFVENVPGIQRLSRRSQPFGGFLERLEAAGYHNPVAYQPVTAHALRRTADSQEIGAAGQPSRIDRAAARDTRSGRKPAIRYRERLDRRPPEHRRGRDARRRSQPPGRAAVGAQPGTDTSDARGWRSTGIGRRG